jgi:hypothetical protein
MHWLLAAENKWHQKLEAAWNRKHCDGIEAINKNVEWEKTLDLRLMD